MSTLPFTLPTCDQPAVDRIEVYSGPDSADASLDASIYACPKHTVDVELTVVAAGLAPRPVPMAPDITRPCGHVHVFPTGAFGGAR
ncbi:hypothetical protein [Micromonospora sp. NPDC047730]|uniref:hypothetical protein n=1 Tax=Micromonospora sp. NPDC047730 TaxID=3364253 RepID=UPI00371A4BC0